MIPIDLDELRDLAEVRDNKQRILELEIRRQHLIIRMSRIVLKAFQEHKTPEIPEEIFDEQETAEVKRNTAEDPELGME